MKSNLSKTKIKKSISLLYCLLLINFSFTMAQTPTWSWVKSSSGPNDENVFKEFVTDNQGNIITKFSYSDTCNYDGASFANTGSLVYKTALIKTSPTGDLIWKKEFGSPTFLMFNIMGLDTDPFGNIYISGAIITLGIPANYQIGDLTISTSNPNGCGFLIKITPAGYALWAKTFSPNTFINSVKTQTDNNGNIFVVGAFTDTIQIDQNTLTTYAVAGNFHDLFLTKIDSSGNYLWAKQFGSYADDQQIEMAKSSDGGVFLATAWYGDSIFVGNLAGVNPSPLANANQDRWLAKIDGQGNTVWLKTENGSAEDPEAYLIGDNSGGVCTITSVSATSPITLNGTTYNTDGALLTYYNQSGTLTVVKHFSGNFGWNPGHISLGTNGSFYLVLNSTSQQITIGSSNFTNTGGGIGTADGYLVKINNSLQPIWALQLGSIETENLAQLRTASDGKLITMGNTNNETLNFGPALSITNVGLLTNDFFIAGLDEPTSIVNIENPGALMVFPNPANDFVRFKSDAPLGSNINVELTDGSGRVVNNISTTSQINNLIDLSECNAGIYFLKISHQNFIQTARIVKQ